MLPLLVDFVWGSIVFDPKLIINGGRICYYVIVNRSYERAALEYFMTIFFK